MAQKKVFGFQKQLKQGEKGEQFFMECYHNLHPRKSSAKEVDIFINENETVELKSDSYPESETENFFMELVGSTKTGKLGGPYLSVQNNVDFFVYHYTSDKTFYWFDPKALVKYIDENGHEFKKREIMNRGWSSMGLLIPRDKIAHLLIKKDTF